MKGTLIVVVGIFFLFLLLFYLGQGKLIYFPQRYSSSSKELQSVEMISYPSGGKEQKLFLYPPDRLAPPNEVWWLFGGNGSVALNWVDLVGAAGLREDQAFVLFDYPGYGLSEGKPTDQTIARSVDASLPVVAKQLGLSEAELKSRSRSIGHSLGAAVALDTAARHGFPEVIMISPFTTMKAMAKRQVGPVFALFLAHHYDNESALDRWLKLPVAESLTIFHGERDRIIPVSMSRELVARGADSEKISMIPVPEVGHNDIIMRIAPAVVEIVVK